MISAMPVLAGVWYNFSFMLPTYESIYKKESLTQITILILLVSLAEKNLQSICYLHTGENNRQ